VELSRPQGAGKLIELGDDCVARAAPLARARGPTHLQGRPPLPVDPLEELIRVVNDPQERDAEDERRLYPR
jgi:hypothetical protein